VFVISTVCKPLVGTLSLESDKVGEACQNKQNKSGNSGDGLAFIVTNEKIDFPENSYGQYLGMFNSTMNGDAMNGDSKNILVSTLPRMGIRITDWLQWSWRFE